MKLITCIFYFFTFIILLCFFSCADKLNNESFESKGSLSYLNHSDSAKYVGINVCASCHIDIYNSFLKTGMGSSFGMASKPKSSAEFNNTLIYDSFSDLNYNAFWKNDALFFNEFRLQNKDTVYKRIEKIDFIIGSGHHTNSHLQWVNGYINQAPMTFYTQQKKWDLPPGFENGHNSRFSRPIGLECMSCHNAFPGFVLGSENKFSQVPNGIDCERCHGPGSIHVNQKRQGVIIDTSKNIDYSIVNPAKLPIERQFDICMRCHLQGNAILSNNKSWFDFKPGMKLSDYITVFLPRYEKADEEFIMASHTDRLQQSKCFIYSLNKAKNNSNQLKPFKDALTCVTCHNPHVSVKETNTSRFNQVCRNCHRTEKNNFCSADQREIKKNDGNCVACHMPSSGSIDIPHVTIHDHYIRKPKPLSKSEISSIKKFLGLQAINNKCPDSAMKARGYVNHFEKFERESYLLDSADKLIPKDYLNNSKSLQTKIQILFNRGAFKEISDLVNRIGSKKITEKYFYSKSLTNDDAWTNYRIAESFSNLGDFRSSLIFYSKANLLSPYNPDFMLKYGVALHLNGKSGEAKKWLTNSLIENPRSARAWLNLGYLFAKEGNLEEAERHYMRAIQIEPDNIQLLTNLGALKIYQNQTELGLEYLLTSIKKDKSKDQKVTLFFAAIEKLISIGKKSKAKHFIIEYSKIFPGDKNLALVRKKINF